MTAARLAERAGAGVRARPAGSVTREGAGGCMGSALARRAACTAGGSQPTRGGTPPTSRGKAVEGGRLQGRYLLGIVFLGLIHLPTLIGSSKGNPLNFAVKNVLTINSSFVRVSNHDRRLLRIRGISEAK